MGPGELRDFGLLDSATNRPQMTVLGEDAYPTIQRTAAAMLHSLARNHPFIDGNKRTPWAATEVFYVMNGFDNPAEDDLVIRLVVDVTEGLLGGQDIAQILKTRVKPFPVADDSIGTS